MRNTAPFFVFLLLLISILTVIIVQLILRHRDQQMLHRERMAALEKGVDVPLAAPLRVSPRLHLLRGLMWTFASLGLVIFLLGMTWATEKPTYNLNITYNAHELEKLGVPQQEARKLAEQDAKARAQGMPEGYALFGLIPMGVGIAYLVFYYSEESRRRAEIARSEPPATLS